MLIKLIFFQDLLVESELVAEGSINGVLNGKHYNRSVRAHKVLHEAFTHLLFDMYLQSLPPESQEKISIFIGKYIFPANAPFYNIDLLLCSVYFVDCIIQIFFEFIR